MAATRAAPRATEPWPLRRRVAAALYSSNATRWIPEAVDSIVGNAADLLDRARGVERPWYVPPRRLRYVVPGGDYLEVGKRQAELFERLGGLTPSSDVLDIGCGVGRIAVPLLSVLEPSARYEGFDISPDAIEWCRTEITPRHPNFRFRLADLHNGRYNPGGTVSPSSYRFPYDDESFDIAVAISVFTHLRPAEAVNYLRETLRVLRPGGRLYSTWYLIDAEDGASTPRFDDDARFQLEVDGFKTTSKRVPEVAIAVEEKRVRQLLEEAGYAGSTIEHPRSGRAQDIVVGEKAASTVPAAF